VDTVDVSTLGNILIRARNFAQQSTPEWGHLAKRSIPKKVQFNSLSQNTSGSF